MFKEPVKEYMNVGALEVLYQVWKYCSSDIDGSTVEQREDEEPSQASTDQG